MTITEAKQLRAGSVFWVPTALFSTRYRLLAVVTRFGSGMVTWDEFGQTAAWLFADRNLWAGARLAKPARATEPEELLAKLRAEGRL